MYTIYRVLVRTNVNRTSEMQVLSDYKDQMAYALDVVRSEVRTVLDSFANGSITLPGFYGVADDESLTAPVKSLISSFEKSAQRCKNT